MLALHLEYIYYKLKKVQGILKTNMLAPLLFTDSFGRYGSKDTNYSIHFMLDFTVFIAVTPEDYYLSMKNE